VTNFSGRKSRPSFYDDGVRRLASEASESADDLRIQIQTLLNGQDQPTVTVLSSLLEIQDALLYLPNEAIEETAAFSNTTINEVWSVASFYTNFRFTPPGEHTYEVCWGPSCHVKGAQQILKSVQEELGIDREGETEDGKVTLKYGTCLGACAQAPVIAIDHYHKGKITTESAARMARKLKG
jgi:NADH-quinone oxidoreductase subunit E